MVIAALPETLRTSCHQSDDMPKHTRDVVRCLDKSAIIIKETDYEKTQHAWDLCWSRITERGALLASILTKECRCIG